ncbi:MAG: hypothetical protein HY313_10355 [Acidobacteria bacterium]|nr:hypothetical protein [Acidobacteriota bacterium]
MSDELYADRIAEIAVTGTVVRLDLMSLSVTERDANKQPKPVFRQRVVMPVEGFVQSFALMTQVMQELEKKGLIRRGEPPEKAGGATIKPAGGDGPPNSKPG